MGVIINNIGGAGKLLNNIGGVQPWSTGPIAVFVGPTNGSGSYLGTCANCPKPDFFRDYRAMPSSFRGLTRSSEYAIMGEWARITMIFSRWSESVYSKWVAQLSTQPRGTINSSVIGTLVMAEEYGIQVSLVFSYQSQSAYSGQPKGYRFPLCRLISNPLLEEGGSEGRILGLDFEADYLYSEENDTWTLCDSNVPNTPFPL